MKFIVKFWFIGSFFASLLFSPIMAQKRYTPTVLDSTVISCTYQLQKMKDTITGALSKEDLMLLQIGNMVSLFQSLHTQQGDTISPEELNRKLNYLFEHQLDLSDRPGTRVTSYYLLKNYPQRRNIRTYDRMIFDAFQYDEPIDVLQWKLEEEYRQILGYHCQKATTSYRGRNWVAWFSCDIPVMEGPWKLAGLPGLILEAYDDKRHYHYLAVGLNATPKIPIIFYQPYRRKYIKTTRKKFLRAKAKMYFNGEAAIATKEFIGTDGTINRPTVRYDFLERDYK